MGGSFSLTGARVSYFDIDKATRRVVGSGPAYDAIYDATGVRVRSLPVSAIDLDERFEQADA